jgi:hypothetical protein
MKKYHIITATAQGLIAYDDKGYAKMIRYGKIQKTQRAPHILKTQSEIEKIHLNLVQREMFRRLMYGLKEYTPEQVASFSPSTLTKIVEDYKKAKRALHVLKAKRFYYAETRLMSAIFPHAKIGEKDHDWYLELPKSVTLRSLGISTKEVLDEFIKRRLLPKNFHDITLENIKLP